MASIRLGIGSEDPSNCGKHWYLGIGIEESKKQQYTRNGLSRSNQKIPDCRAHSHSPPVSKPFPSILRTVFSPSPHQHHLRQCTTTTTTSTHFLQSTPHLHNAPQKLTAHHPPRWHCLHHPRPDVSALHTEAKEEQDQGLDGLLGRRLATPPSRRRSRRLLLHTGGILFSLAICLHTGSGLENLVWGIWSTLAMLYSRIFVYTCGRVDILSRNISWQMSSWVISLRRMLSRTISWRAKL